MSVNFNLEFIEIESMEDCPCGDELIVWDGCDFRITYCDIDVDTGCVYDTNFPDCPEPFVAYAALPDKRYAEIKLGNGE